MADVSGNEVNLEALLAVQLGDLEADQLRHRRASLPERSMLADERKAIGELEVEADSVESPRSELATRQARQEDEIGSLSTKISELDAKLHSSSLKTPRDLQAMQAEVESMKRRRVVLEDQLIEVMEQAEELDAALAEIAKRTAAHVAEVARLKPLIAEAESSVDKVLEDLATKREVLVRDVANDLVAKYEGLRARLGGIGIARLEAGRCMGCHLELPSVELDAIRHAPAGAILIHEECGRMLVR